METGSSVSIFIFYEVNMESKELVKEAFKARENSYSPYSGFSVGAALLCKNGKVYRGCNMENAAYSPGICAERAAIYKAVSEGDKEFSKIAIVGGPTGGKIEKYAFPCGVCRQVMMEFVDPDNFIIVVAISENEYKEYTLKELLPEGFGPDNL